MSEDDSQHERGTADCGDPEHEALTTNAGVAAPDGRNAGSANGELTEATR